MRENAKTKKDLINELKELRLKVRRLEAAQGNRYKLAANKDQEGVLFNLLLEYLPFPIIIYDPTNKTKYLNSKFTEIFGYTIKDIGSRDEWMKKAYPDQNYREQIEKEAVSVKSSEKMGFHGAERKITCADGSLKDGMLYSIYLPDGNYFIIVADISDLKKSQNAIMENMQKFQTVYKSSPVPAFLWKREGDDFTLIDYSHSAEEFTGGNLKDYLGSKFKPLFRDMPHSFDDMERCFYNRTIVKNEHPYRLRTTSEMKSIASFFTFISPDLVLAHIVDITEYKNIEKSLREKEEKLQLEAKRLEEANIALKVLLEYRGEEKRKVHENVINAVTQLILPFVEKLERSSLDSEQSVFLDAIKSNLSEITSPLATRLSYRYAGLSPSEFTVANLVREGKSIKEAADLLNVSEEAICKHRKNIRVKLGIKNKKVNLHSYLLQLSKE